MTDLTKEESYSEMEKVVSDNNENSIIETAHRKTKFEELTEETTDFETYSSHENLHKELESEKIHRDLLNAIDRTLIRFGLNDCSAYDDNMNEEKCSHNITANDNTELFIPTIENILNSKCEYKLRKKKAEEANGTEDLGKVNRDDCDRDVPRTSNDIDNYSALTKSTNTGSFPLRKSKSAPNPFKNVRLKVGKSFGKGFGWCSSLWLPARRYRLKFCMVCKCLACGLLKRDRKILTSFSPPSPPRTQTKFEFFLEQLPSPSLILVCALSNFCCEWSTSS